MSLPNEDKIKGRRVRDFVLALIVAIACATTASSQTSGCIDDAPAKNIELLWAMAARGELLTPEGWHRASGYFAKPNEQHDDKVVEVMSGYYGLNSYSNDGKVATVDMEFTDAGKIDSSLHYTPPKETEAYKTAFRYKLVAGPAYITWYGPDGKTVQKKEIPGEKAWLIDSPPPRPWATVNAAIRYVLEMRNKTNDPIIKKNADETLAILLRMH